MSTYNTDNRVWELPFGEVPELELRAEFGTLAFVPVESGQPARVELTPRSAEHVAVSVDNVNAAVRVALEPLHGFHWFGGWECRATVYVPSNVRAHVETSAGSVSVRDLDACELGIKATTGKIDLVNVHGLLHLAADAGSITGRDVGGFLNIEAQAGSVRLEVSELKPGEHRIRATMGSVRLDLARGLDVSIEAHASLGSVRNSYPARQAAAAKLLLTTDMGSVRIDQSYTLQARTPRSTAAEVSAAPEPRADAADPELERVLKMVESGELSAHDADELLRAMDRA
jgi:Putative adhesin